MKPNITPKKVNMIKTEVLEKHEPSYLPDGKKWKLVWNDEFDSTELDRTK